MKNTRIGITATRLALAALSLFLWARAYQHFFFEGPYRSFFLDQALFGGIQNLISDLSWLEFVTDPQTDRAILFYTRFMACVWLLTGLLVLGYRRVSGPLLWVLAILSSLGLMFYGASDYLDKGYQLAQWLEYAAQIVMPIWVLYLLKKGPSGPLLFVAKGAIALTFLGHGLYAIGYFPVPGHFVYMTTDILPLSDDGARQLLFIAGVLDLVAVGALFVPQVDRWALAYCVLWGFFTALARPVAYIEPGPVFWVSVHQSVYEFFVRIPHFILPLCVLWLGKRTKVKGLPCGIA